MKVIVPHHTTQQKAIDLVDKSAGDLFDIGSKSINMIDQRKVWIGPKMDFGMIAKVGFISLPLNGTVLVDDVNVTIECELPALAKNFIGEDKIRAGIEQKVKGFLPA
jgi:hypothetical protein